MKYNHVKTKNTHIFLQNSWNKPLQSIFKYLKINQRITEREKERERGEKRKKKEKKS